MEPLSIESDLGGVQLDLRRRHENKDGENDDVDDDVRFHRDEARGKEPSLLWALAKVCLFASIISVGKPVDFL